VLGRTDRRLRILVLLVAFAVFAVAAVARLGYWQVAQAPDLRVQAINTMVRPTQQPAIRGNIFDRNGTLLATTAFRDALALYPKLVLKDDRSSLVDLLAPILHLGPAGKDSLAADLDANGEYVVEKRELTFDQSQQLRKALDTLPANIAYLSRAVSLEPHAVRVYPAEGGAPGTTLASQLLGFVNAEGIGSYGIEQQYNSVLAGTPTVFDSLQDSSGRVLETTSQVVQQGANGLDIHLTIDARLQLQLETEIYAAWVADNSKQVSALIMDPRNGEILAWASVPGYDANNYAEIAANQSELMQDPIVSQIYEPGSVMKMFTAAAAIDAGVVTPTTKVHDVYALHFGNDTIHDSDHRAMGWMPFRDAIAYSRNVVAAQVARRLDTTVDKASAKLYKTWQRFGIGSPTGIDLSGEVPGIAADPNVTKWQPVDLANRSFGQSVAVTPIQLGTGYTAMINGGFRVQPHVLAGIGPDAQAVKPPTRIISASLAGQLQGILHHVTASVPWYAQGSLIPGYQVGGKTGTAQMFDTQKGKYSYNTFNFTFVGYVGGASPNAVIVTHIGEASPKVIKQGDLELGITSYQLFRRIANDTIHTLGIPRLSDPTAGLPEPGSAAQKDLFPDLYARWKLGLGPYYGGPHGGGGPNGHGPDPSPTPRR
jgi:cell division protein FtsI (penicillin-binding protein 3)